MPDSVVKGTTGYADVVEHFIEATCSLRFETLHASFLELIPSKPGQVLDVGSGVGRDSVVLATMGHKVTAVEPEPVFRQAAKRLHDSPRINWVDDALPSLANVSGRFDFILISAVWHHLDDSERERSMSRLSDLLTDGATLALSLRHGPAGAGSHVFPVDGKNTIQLARSFDLDCIRSYFDQPSQMAGKDDVTWTQLAFARKARF